LGQIYEYITNSNYLKPTHTSSSKVFKQSSQIWRHQSLCLTNTSFKFDDNCLTAFNILTEKLISSPIITGLDWKFNFEIMCDASDYAVGVVLRQRTLQEKMF